MTLKAIDCHVHPWDDVSLGSMGGGRQGAMSSYFGRELPPVSMADLAEAYRGRAMMAVLLASDDSTSSGLPPVPNDHIARAVRDYPDTFLGFGGVDPWMGRLALEEVRRIKDLGLHGLKFNPGRQHFYANDPRFAPLWGLAAELGLVCLFHTGMMGNGAGVRGGLGFKLKYTAPIPYLDDIAADHPGLTLISAHPGWPWQDEQLAMARHKGNVYLDLSGWAPRYFPPQLVQQVNRLLPDRTLFGSDWPVITPERWLAEFDQLPFDDAVRRKILLDNAKALFGLT
ncbi:MAG: 4-hydroxyphenyl-beta-ketoacyl-CoA hydrolase [Marmoricola sp.]|jgi:predicted TIM-barrel fold metal-dependent hydrolase|nr:4-hydroxyphenyl-beta-ketoacyl-CoA hydrolase [Marmoricola sp.]